MVETRVKTITPKILTLGVFSLLLLSGCQQALNNTGRFMSATGVKMEAFLPADTFLLIKVGTQDEAQIASLKTLNAYFPNDPMGSLVKEFNDGFKEGANLDEMGLDYQNDILPILNEKSEMMLAVAPGKAPAADQATDSTNTMEINAVLVLTLGDQGKFDNLLQKQTEKGKLKQDTYNGKAYYTETDETDVPAYIFRHQDVAVVTTTLDSMKGGLDNLQSGKNPVADNPTYQKALNDYYKPSIALVYGDFSKVVDFMAKASSDGEDVAKTINSLNAGANAKDIQAEILLITAEKSGLRMTAHVIAKEGSDLTKLMGEVDEVYLASKIPAQDPVLYSEGSNLRKAYDQFLVMAKQDPQFAETMQELTDYLKAQDLDLEKDILTFLDKGYAFVLEDNGSILPSIGFYLDASGNPESAAKVAAKINTGFQETFAQAKKDNPELELLMNMEEVTAGKLWKFKLNIDPLLSEMPESIAQKFSGQKVEFYYGLLADNTMVFALSPDLEKNYGKVHTVAQGAEYQKAMGYLNNPKRSIGYFAPGQIVVYADRLLQLAKQAGAIPTVPLEYELVKSYISPIKSLSFGTHTIEKAHIHSEAFLHIANE